MGEQIGRINSSIRMSFEKAQCELILKTPISETENLIFIDRMNEAFIRMESVAIEALQKLAEAVIPDDPKKGQKRAS